MIDDDAALRFTREARASGLALPTSRRFDSRLVLGGIAVIVAVSLLVGYSSGWMNLSRPAPNPLAQLPGCPPAGVSLGVAAQSGASVGLASAATALAAGFSAATGGCLSTTVASDPTGFGALSAKSVDAAIGPLVPTAGSLPAPVYSVPLLVSPVVVIVNAEGLPARLNLSAPALAGAYLGEITSWSSPLLTGTNPGLTSSLNVSVAYLAGPSEANALLSGYLAERNASFARSVGSGTNVSWPAGTVASSPAAMLTLLASTPGRIGYEPTDVCPALPSGLVCAAIETGTSSYVLPSPGAVAAAADLVANSSAATGLHWANVSGLASTSASVYPMLEITYAFVYKDLGTSYAGALTLNESKWLIASLFWVASDTSSSAGPIVQPYGYYALPDGFAFEAEKTSLSVTYEGGWVLLPPSSVTGSDNEAGEGSGETGEF